MTEKFHCEQESERDHVFEACFAKSLMELVKKSKAYPEIQRRNAELESQLNASLAERDILQSQLAELQGRVVEWRKGGYQYAEAPSMEGLDDCLLVLGSGFITKAHPVGVEVLGEFFSSDGDRVSWNEVDWFVPLSSLPLPKGE